jgi:hypothetical protein
MSSPTASLIFLNVSTINLALFSTDPPYSSVLLLNLVDKNREAKFN